MGGHTSVGPWALVWCVRAMGACGEGLGTCIGPGGGQMWQKAEAVWGCVGLHGGGAGLAGRLWGPLCMHN